MSLTRSLIVVADLHLSHWAPPTLAFALERVLQRHPGSALMLAGDTFDLSLVPKSGCCDRAVASLLGEHHQLRSALRQWLLAGNPLTVIAGNHDRALVNEATRSALAETLEVNEQAPLHFSPWFARCGTVHVEHGHVYDPDNAPVSPLVADVADDEPLGVALTRRVLAPTGALKLAHAHETTPLAGLIRTLAEFGPRGVSVVARYFAIAAGLCWRSLERSRWQANRQEGARRLATFADRCCVEPGILLSLAKVAAVPTHTRLAATFRRLYLDRASATALMAVAGAVALSGPATAPSVVAAVAAAYLMLSCGFEGTNRYAGLLEQRLREAACAVRDVTGAELVIFGHSHHQDEMPGYLNPGAFGVPQGLAPRYAWVPVGAKPTLRSAR